MPRRTVVTIAVALAGVAALPAAAAQARKPPPAPVAVAPADQREYPPPLRAVTFQVKGQRQERAPGKLRVQFTDADGTVDRTGRYHAEGGVDDYPLEQSAPGSTTWTVTVPASAFRRYSDKRFFWQAYRLLPSDQCRRIKRTRRYDCFQESAGREFAMIEPYGYNNFEPNDSPEAADVGFFNRDCAFLEKRTDVDWFRHDGVPRPMELTLTLFNWADTDRWEALRPPAQESADMSATVYEADGVRQVATMHVPVGVNRKMKVPLAANTPYLIAFAHASNGHATARPAANMSYRFAFNFPSDFESSGCG